MIAKPEIETFLDGSILICFGDPLPNGASEGWVNSIGDWVNISKSNFDRISLTKGAKAINETKANNQAIRSPINRPNQKHGSNHLEYANQRFFGWLG